jgi:hypothetical protein
MKSNLARKRDDSAVHQTTGTVVAADRAGVVVATAEGRLTARRAKSCLVEPSVGDEALVCVVGDAAYVLAILEGEPDAQTTLAVDGDMAIKVASGRLSLAAQEGVSVVSAKEVSVAAPALSVHAGVAHAVLDRLTWLAAKVRGEVERSEIVAGSIDRVVGRITERAQRVYRKVEELDQLYAESVDWEAKKNLSLHCENALVTAEKLVKIDGDQIHLG